MALALAATAACGTAQPALQEAQLCELWIGHELREITDAWDRRIVVSVECAPSSSSGQGYVLVRLRAADGEAPLPDAAIRALEERVARALDDEVERRGWRVRYPTLTVEYAGP